MAESIAPVALKEMLESGGSVKLVDVRTHEERQHARIEPSIHLVDETTAESLLSHDDGTPVVFYCHHGIRSLHAASWFEQRGLKRPMNLDGGIDRWSAEVDRDVPRY